MKSSSSPPCPEFECHWHDICRPAGDYGIALFSRLPVLAVRRIDLHVPTVSPGVPGR